MAPDPGKPILIMVGTRPEGIKMMPVYFALKTAGLPVLLCSSGQHNKLLNEVFDLFNIAPDYSLHVMKENQDLFHITGDILNKTRDIFSAINPSLILVQGDTTTAMTTALAAFYLKIPVGHVEAGLRTENIWNPYPEEINRRLISTLSSFNFAPTPQAAKNLLDESIQDSTVYLTGNTIVDSLRIIQEKINTELIPIAAEIKDIVTRIKQHYKSLILFTIHRRESFGKEIEQVLKAIKHCAQQYPNTIFFYPTHPNPVIRQAIQNINLTEKNILLSEPLSYQNLIFLILNSNLIITDSGGICEEAISLSKPTLIVRKETERPEALWSGLAYLVGTDQDQIANYVQTGIERKEHTNKINCPFGDGYAAEKIVSILKNHLNQSSNNELMYGYFQKRIIMKKVCVLGLGYIGLPTAIIASQYNFEVFGFDIDKDRVKKINNCDPVIEEPEIFENLKLSLDSGNFHAVDEIKTADYFIIAVPTPFKKDKNADLSFMWAAVESICTVLKPNDTIILESTVPVKTTEQLAQRVEFITKLKAGIDFFVAHCPERVLPGKIFHELIYNARIIGGINKKSVEQAKLFYKQFVKGPLYLTTATAAEMVKLVENSSRDVQIAFANQVAAMAYESNLNPFEIIELANKHPRVSILNPGCGVGGHCIAVDPWFLIKSFPTQTTLLHAARKINENKPLQIINSLKQCAKEWQVKNKKNPRVLLLGLTYKQDIDDLRESPALHIANTLVDEPSMTVIVCDPHVTKNRLDTPLRNIITSVEEAISQADFVVCLVKHKIFSKISKEQLSGKVIFDVCGLFYESDRATNLQDYDYWPTENYFNIFSASLNEFKEL